MEGGGVELRFTDALVPTPTIKPPPAPPVGAIGVSTPPPEFKELDELLVFAGGPLEPVGPICPLFPVGPVEFMAREPCIPRGPGNPNNPVSPLGP
jgi:hypothetical protein